jgi:hypothetical protein
MAFELALLNLLALTVLFVSWQHRLAHQRGRAISEERAWIAAFFVPAAATSMAFAILGMTFMQQLDVTWTADRLGAQELTPLWLWRHQAGVIFGTAWLLTVASKGLTTATTASHGPKDAAILIQLDTYEQIAREHWLQILGGLLLGGLLAGIGPAVMVAVEITVCWGLFKMAAWARGL